MTPTACPGLLDLLGVLAGRGEGGRGEAGEVGAAGNPPVRAAYQIRPAPSAAEPPMATAASWKARLGMPELRWTPPWSSVVST